MRPSRLCVAVLAGAVASLTDGFGFEPRSPNGSQKAVIRQQTLTSRVLEAPAVRDRSSSLHSTAEASEIGEDETPTKTSQLGLLTFDLDDTLYPVKVVIEEAVSVT